MLNFKVSWENRQIPVKGVQEIDIPRSQLEEESIEVDYFPVKYIGKFIYRENRSYSWQWKYLKKQYQKKM